MAKSPKPTRKTRADKLQSQSSASRRSIKDKMISSHHGLENESKGNIDPIQLHNHYHTLYKEGARKRRRSSKAAPQEVTKFKTLPRSKKHHFHTTWHTNCKKLHKYALSRQHISMYIVLSSIGIDIFPGANSQE